MTTAHAIAPLALDAPEAVDPARVGRPATSKRFFTAKGTPASGPGSRPPATVASTASESASARWVVTSVKALI